MKNYIKVNKEAYDTLAEEYKQKMKEYIISDRTIIVPFVDYLKTHFDKVKVLELGPGSGLNLTYFEEEGFDTTAIDISGEILKISQEIAPKTKYIFADFLVFDFGKTKFQGVFAKAFIHLFPKKDAVVVLKKIFDLLEEKGCAFLTTTIHDKAEEAFFEKEDYDKKMKRFRKKWLENELLEEITKVGFKIYDAKYNIEDDKKKKWIGIVLTK
jgi:2-polyprenyl-3-methyl-5-hydroxy-6-metoxy-1,4-benzoquinol methylase